MAVHTIHHSKKTCEPCRERHSDRSCQTRVVSNVALPVTVAQKGGVRGAWKPCLSHPRPSHCSSPPLSRSSCRHIADDHVLQRGWLMVGWLVGELDLESWWCFVFFCFLGTAINSAIFVSQNDTLLVKSFERFLNFQYKTIMEEQTKSVWAFHPKTHHTKNSGFLSMVFPSDIPGFSKFSKFIPEKNLPNVRDRNSCGNLTLNIMKPRKENH